MTDNDYNSRGIVAPQQPAYTMKRPTVFEEGAITYGAINWTYMEPNLLGDLAESGIEVLKQIQSLDEFNKDLKFKETEQDFKEQEGLWNEKLRLWGLGQDFYDKYHSFTPPSGPEPMSSPIPQNFLDAQEQIEEWKRMLRGNFRP